METNLNDKLDEKRLIPSSLGCWRWKRIILSKRIQSGND